MVVVTCCYCAKQISFSPSGRYPTVVAWVDDDEESASREMTVKEQICVLLAAMDIQDHYITEQRSTLCKLGLFTAGLVLLYFTTRFSTTITSRGW